MIALSKFLRVAQFCFLVIGTLGSIQGATLLKYNFSAGSTWTGMAGYSSAPGGSITATPSVTTVGTVDGYGATSNVDVNNVASSGVKFLVNSASAGGTWTAGVDSGLLTVPITSITNPGLVTLGFSLSSSNANPILVRVESYDSANNRTGGLKKLIYPAAAAFYQRFAIDLSTMSPDGAGTFNPVSATSPGLSKIRIFFEIGTATGGEAWPNSSALELHFDNVNYATPKYYVKPSSPGSDSNDGLTDATPWKTISKAVSAAVPGDIIVLMGGEADQFVAGANTGLVSFQKPGTPDAWIVLKNYPGQRPVLMSAWWNTIGMGRGSSSAHYTGKDVPAYIEVRGLTVRGYSSVDANGDRQIAPQYKAYVGLSDPRSNNNGIGIDGRNSDYFMHDLRIADNVVEYCTGSGIGGGMVDRVTFENNISRYNTWWSIYGGSGFSLGISVATEANSDTRILIQNNESYGNEGMIPWRAINAISDGNGIIVDTNQISKSGVNPFNIPDYTGRTLVQNNLVYNNGGSGIHAFQSAHVDILHNTAYRNSASPRLLYSQMFAGYSSDVRMLNNILVAPNNPTGSASFNENITSNGSNTNASIFYKNNVFYGEGNNQTLPTNGTNFANNTTGNPLFLSPSVDPVTNDFHLRTTSPALNNGLPLGDALLPARSALDFAGRSRSLSSGFLPDRGAYQTQAGDVYAPVFTPQSGNYTSAQSVALTSDTANATIVYTTNGSTPTVDASGIPTNGTVYPQTNPSTTIPLSSATTLKAIAWKSGGPIVISYVSTAGYTFNATPAAIPALSFDTWPLTDDGTRYVSVVCATPGAWVRYTLDGSTPSTTNGTIAPAKAIPVTAGNLIKAIAYQTGRANSAVLTGNFVVRPKMGSLNAGTTTDVLGANRMRFSRFQPFSLFTATRIYAKVGAIAGSYRTAIYADNAGVPGALKASSGAVTNPATGWQAFTLASPLDLPTKDSNGNVLSYWLAIWSNDAAASVYTTTTGGTLREATSTFSTTWPATAPASAASVSPSSATNTYSIFAATSYRPVVSAGSNQTLATTTTPANLAGTATDNSTPAVALASGVLTTTWSTVSGPGTVTFANSAALATTATFSQSGTYTLRLTGQDNLFTPFVPVTSDVTITVPGAVAGTATTTSLSSSSSMATVGNAITFAATVASSSGIPAGTVTFYDGSSTLGSATLNTSGVATLTTSALTVGSHLVSASFAANGVFAASSSGSLAETILLPDGTTRLKAINSAGNDVGGFLTDVSFTGGAASTTTNAISLAGLTNPAPQAVYQSERYGTSFSYTLGGLDPLAAYLVRLHFSENWWGLAGRGGTDKTVGIRLANISINGTTRLSAFDIWAAAGASNKGVIREFAAETDAAGQITINFSGAAGGSDPKALVDGLEIYTVTPFDAWRVDNFTPLQLDNVAISSLLSDPDGDKVGNLLEYALGMDPLSPGTEGLPVVGQDEDGHLTLTFRHARGDVVYSVEGTSDLVIWTPLPGDSGSIGQSVTIPDTAPLDGAPRFLRLRVTR